MSYKDPAKQRKAQRDFIMRRRLRWLAEHGPCAECGSREDLELDHKDRAQKVNHRVWSWTAERREAELAKCQVLCRDCHQEKTRAENVKPIVHGTADGYRNHRCRCPACREAHRLYHQGFRNPIAPARIERATSPL